MSDGIAVGVPVFSRTAALEQFLESVPEYVETVYVADNGIPAERVDLYYGREWPWELEELTVPYDSGIGACRSAICDALTEPFLWVGDCDMEILRENDLRQLRRILDANPGLGGVSGWLSEDDTVRSGARNLVENDGVLYKTADGGADELESDPLPFARWDMIPQCGLFRAEAFEDYAYDADVFNTEHLDFFVGHQQAGAWEFASTPAVVVAHHRNIDPEYRESKRGQNHVDIGLMREKWGVEGIAIGARPDWVTTRERAIHEQAFDILRRATPPAVWRPIRRTAMGVLS